MYYYKFCKDSAKHFTYSPFLLRVFKRRKDWKEGSDKNMAHYTACANIKKRISDPYSEWGFFNRKTYLAKRLQGVSYYPETLIIHNRSLIKGAVPKDGRWFLKKDVSYGGKDVIIIDDTSNYKKELSKLNNFTRYSKTDRKYVMQKEIKPHLYKGRKYDLRLYIVMGKKKDEFRLFMFNDGYVRVAFKEYTGEGLSLAENLTNITPWLQTNKTPMLFCFKELPNYEEVYSKIKDFMPDLFKRIKNDFFKNKEYGFSIFGIDVIVKEDGNPVILEMNNVVGYKPPSSISKKIASMHHNMIGGVIDAIFIPIIEKKRFTSIAGWDLIDEQV